MTRPNTDHILEAATRALETWHLRNVHQSRLSFIQQLIEQLDEHYVEFAQQEYLRGLEEGYASGRESQT